MSRIDSTFAVLKSVADGWEQEAQQRRRFTAVDPVADTLDHCAGELRHQIGLCRDGLGSLSVEDYARDEGVTPQSVRLWIRTGQLSASKDNAGHWHIRRGAKRHVRVRQSA